MYRKGKLLKGTEKEEALRKWKMAADPSVYCWPSSYGPQNINWDGLP